MRIDNVFILFNIELAFFLSISLPPAIASNAVFRFISIFLLFVLISKINYVLAWLIGGYVGGVVSIFVLSCDLFVFFFLLFVFSYHDRLPVVFNIERITCIQFVEYDFMKCVERGIASRPQPKPQQPEKLRC